MVQKDLSSIMDDSLLATTIHAETVQQLADYIFHLRRLPVWGYFMFLPSPLTTHDADDLSQVPFALPAMDILSDLFVSIRILIENIFNSSKLHSGLYSFLKDVIRYLDNTEQINYEKTQSIIDDFRILEQKYLSGDIDTAFLPPETLRHLSLIKKLLKACILLKR
jgi:hypothetical protein